MNEKILFAGKKYINERFLYVMVWCGLLGVNLLGVLLDILAFLGYPGITVENLADYAAVVIQVQATIAALGLTVVTLLGNVLNKKILGIGVAEFILNRQHRILNQRNATVFCMILSGISVFVYVIHLYNLIFTLFLSTLIIIIYMLFSVCQIFQSEDRLFGKISDYLICNALRNDDVLEAFLKFPCQEIDELKGYKSDQYSEVVCEIWKKELNVIAEADKAENIFEGQKQQFVFLVKNMEKTIAAFIDSQDGEQLAVGLELLYKVYDIYLESGIVRSAWNEITIFSDVNENIVRASRRAKEDDCFWMYFSIPDIVLKTAVYSELKTDESDRRSMVRVTSDASKIKSYYISLIYSSRDVELSPHEKYWMGYLIQDGPYTLGPVARSDSTIADECEYTIAVGAAEILLGYTWALIQYGYKDIVQNVFFDAFLQRAYLGISELDARYGMSVLMYIYYVAYQEEKSLTDLYGSLRMDCRELMQKNEALIKRFADILIEDDYISADMLDWIKKNLRMYEILPTDKAKLMIMEAVVDEYIVLMTALCTISTERFQRILSKVIGDRYFSFYEMFCEPERETKVRNAISYIYYGYVWSETGGVQEETDVKQQDIIYQMVTTTIAGLYAENAWKEVVDRAASVQIEPAEQKLCQLVEDHLRQNVERMLSPLAEEQTGKNAINEKKQQKTVTLLCMEVPIQMLEETSLVDRIADVLDSNLVSLLYSVWFKDHLEHYVIKNDKQALENYLAKVSTYETDFILGRNFSWLTCAGEDYRRYRERLDSIDHWMVYGDQDFILDLNTRRFEISLINVETVICDLSLKEIDERIRQDADVCSVNVTNNIWLNYSREKAREYIKRSRKRIDIRCTLECGFYADMIGIATHVQ